MQKKNIILSAGELQYLANGLKKEIMLLRGQLKNKKGRRSSYYPGI